METWLTVLLLVWIALLLALGIMGVIFCVKRLNSREEGFSNEINPQP